MLKNFQQSMMYSQRWVVEEGCHPVLESRLGARENNLSEGLLDVGNCRTLRNFAFDWFSYSSYFHHLIELHISKGTIPHQFRTVSLSKESVGQLPRWPCVYIYVGIMPTLSSFILDDSSSLSLKSHHHHHGLPKILRRFTPFPIKRPHRRSTQVLSFNAILWRCCIRP